MIDQTHLITTLFSLVNVPSGIWIDEEGRIVRINEGNYAAVHRIGTSEIGTDDYVPAVKDWAEKGAGSRYVWSRDEVKKHVRIMTPELKLADPTFKLGVYFYEQGDIERANKYWEEAQALDPDNWNFHRQDWSFTASERTQKFLDKRSKLGDKPVLRAARARRTAAGGPGSETRALRRAQRPQSRTRRSGRAAIAPSRHARQRQHRHGPAGARADVAPRDG